ncbi:ABC-F family ATP-binding cassette domain-containing protein [Candidatus Saccharibacteria bacterium]|nr:ABC-F family ATP-binding cassette domain-containing protein [Candidatus Saccharibacteria bacterium]
MIILKDVTKTYKDKAVLDEAELSVNPQEIIGLVGKNGAGKTTLMRIILGEIKPDSGTVQTSDEIVGYLPQHSDFGEQTVQEFLQSKLPAEHLGWKIDKNLDLVGLKGIDVQKNANSLSGGQKTRLGLAALLLAEPEPTVLLLDEPTNNLDAEGLKWLRSFIKQFRGSVLLTSHDRGFLDESVNRIVELDNGKAKNYGGNYSFYREQKQLEYQSQLDKCEKSQLEQKKLKRTIVAQKEKARHVQSNFKQKDNDKFAKAFFKNRVTVKLDKQASALESRLEQLDDVERPMQRKSYKVELEGSVPSSKMILKVESLSKSFDGHIVLSDLSFEVYGGERVWVSGVNGSGKSTLLKIAAGIESPDSGSVQLGNNLEFGYFSQEATGLNLSETGIADLLSTGAKPQVCFEQAKSLHITEQDLKKPLSELSRGQIAKVAFAKLLLGQNQLLILDEPTNHLEIETREEIEAALSEYKGAIVVASHDKYFLDAIGVTKELSVIDGKTFGVTS